MLGDYPLKELVSGVAGVSECFIDLLLKFPGKLDGFVCILTRAAMVSESWPQTLS
jgi:hypothetical protein